MNVLLDARGGGHGGMITGVCLNEDDVENGADVPICPEAEDKDHYQYQVAYDVWTISKELYREVTGSLYPANSRKTMTTFGCPICGCIYSSYNSLSNHLGLPVAKAFHEPESAAIVQTRLTNSSSPHLLFNKEGWAKRVGIISIINGLPNPLHEAITHSKDMIWEMFTNDRVGFARWLQDTRNQFYFKNFLKAGYGEAQVVACMKDEDEIRKIIGDSMDGLPARHVYHEYPTGMQGYNAFDAVAMRKHKDGSIIKHDEVIIGQGKVGGNPAKSNMYESFIHDLVAGFRRFGRVDGMLSQVMANYDMSTFIADLP